MTDLITGPVKETPLPPTKPPISRKIEEYKGEPPRGEAGKYPKIYEIQERCGLTDDKGTCKLFLRVQRVMNVKFERDESGMGGQLEYDEDDVKQFKFCPKHGPFNSPDKW